jgi:hypothetical protein
MFDRVRSIQASRQICAHAAASPSRTSSKPGTALFACPCSTSGLPSSRPAAPAKRHALLVTFFRAHELPLADCSRRSLHPSPQHALLQARPQQPPTIAARPRRACLKPHRRRLSASGLCFVYPATIFTSNVGCPSSSPSTTG